MPHNHPKKFVCHWQDSPDAVICGKAFSRSDHLHRHELNHSSGGSTCERCHAHFKRHDLLARHLERHKQKDDEAGGEGLGVVGTRKRLWRDADGNIVAKRPACPNKLANSRSVADEDHSEVIDEQERLEQVPLSSPSSQQALEPNDLHRSYQDDLQASSEIQVFDYIASTSVPLQGNDMLDFLANSSWGQNQGPATQSSVKHGKSRVWDDAFAPDTAASFNAPYTTMSNYSWLFDVNAPGGYDIHLSTQANQWPQHIGSNGGNTLPSADMGLSSAPSSAYQHHMPQQPERQGMNIPMQTFLSHPGYSSVPCNHTEQSVSSQRQTLSHHTSEQQSTASTSPEALSASDLSMTSSRTSVSQHSSTKYTQPILGKHAPSATHPEPSSVESFHPYKSVRCSSLCLPRLREEDRQRLLDIIIHAGTRTPDGMIVTTEHPLLSLESLQKWSDLFFTCFNASYPLIHTATFDPSEIQPLLLMSVLLLGATYGDKSAHRLAVCVHDIIRSQIFAHMSFGPEPELWVLQSILLTECFGKSRAGQRQHDMSHLFHGLLINLIRRSNCQTVQQPEFGDSTLDLESQWRTAMDTEQRKRLCQLCFLWDVEHAVLFSQSLCMSSFEIRTALPCSPAVWEAETAEEWQHHMSREPAPKLFLPILKSYMSFSAPAQSQNLNALSQLLILHGLLSVSWDFARRDQTSLGCGSLIGTDDWRARIGASLDAWKASFETYCMNISSSLNSSSSQHDYDIKSDFQRFTTSTLAIYHAAHIILNIEILDLQIYAGARHIIGRPVSRSDFERSRRKVRDWVQQKPNTGTATSTACIAAWHAAQLLRDGIVNLDNFEVNNAFHYPWCLYLATLTCWAFHHGSRDDRGNSNINPESASEEATSMSMGIYADEASESSMYDAKAEMNGLVSGMTSGVPEGLWRIAGKYSTRGLTTVIAHHLSNVRWAVIHEGMKVLRGLMARKEAL